MQVTTEDRIPVSAISPGRLFLSAYPPAILPGETIEAAVARVLGLSEEVAGRFLEGTERLSPGVARRLERYTAAPARMWLTLDRSYQACLTRPLAQEPGRPAATAAAAGEARPTGERGPMALITKHMESRDIGSE